MNRHNLPSQTNPPYTNGHHETPLDVSGVSLRPSNPAQPLTIFVPEVPVRGQGPLLYALHRFHLGGMSLARYLFALWIAIAVLAAGGVLPGRWFTAALALLLLIGQVVLSRRAQRHKYVHFESATAPMLHAPPLDPSEKLPIYATGLLSVEGRYRHYSALPGFYRTFATGEHAILCRVQERTWLGVASWPADEVGMWYAFIDPAAIESLVWGNLTFGHTTYPAVAIQYRLELPAGPRRKRAEFRPETLYLAAPETQDAARIYADLLNNLPVEAQLAPHSTVC